MKNEMTLMRRLKVCWTFFKMVDSSFLGEYCPVCGSHRIRAYDRVNAYDSEEDTHIYIANYVCQKCGATAKVKEEWVKGE